MSTGSFLDRWSQRKRAAPERETVDEGAAAEDATPAAARADAAAGPSPLADPPDLPPLDSLRPDTPLTPFFQPGVPPDLKNAALRTMWLLDPAIRDHVDFAVDYAWDWNVPGGVPGHGGALSPAHVARALGRLTGPAAEPASPPPAAETPDPAAPDAAAPAPAAPDPAAEPASVASPPMADGPGPASPPPGRRHGGAVPV